MKMVLITCVNIAGSDESAHPRSLGQSLCCSLTLKGTRQSFKRRAEDLTILSGMFEGKPDDVLMR